MSKKRKEPSLKNPPPKKGARKSADPNSYLSQTVSWAVSRLDRDSRWGWNGIPIDEFWNDIISKLRDFETMYWREIKCGGKSHSIFFLSWCAANPLATARATERM